MSQPPYPQHRPQLPGRPRGPHASYETRRDVEAALAAQRELGPEYADEVAEGLAERVEQLVAYRIAEVRREPDLERAHLEQENSSRRQQFVLGLVSLGAGIPITAISGSVVEPGLIGVLVAWGGIVSVNVAHALSARRRR
jgi:hypothetical protein